MSLVLEVVGAKTGTSVLFIKLNSVYAECEFLIKGEPKLHPFICLRDTCHRGLSCMQTLAHRVKYIFDSWEKAQVLLLYFSYPDKPGSQRAGIFYRDMREPRYITFNRKAWEKVKAVGTVYEWKIPDNILLSSSANKLHQIGKNNG